MEAARPRKVLGLRDAVGITGDEDRERGSLAAAHLVSSSVWQPSEAQPPPAPWAAIVVQGSKAELRPEAGRGHGQRPSAASTRTPRSALCSSESYVSLSPRRLSATVPAPHPCPISSVVTWTRSALRGHTETCFARFRGTAGFQV